MDAFYHLIYRHGDAIVNDSWVYDRSTAWPQFHIEHIVNIMPVIRQCAV